MENIRPTSTEKEPESQAATSDDSIKFKGSEPMASVESRSSSVGTNAATRKDSPKIWKSAALRALKSKAGLVAGSLSDFQTAGGKVAVSQMKYEYNGQEYTATKLILVAEGLNLVAVDTPDGLDFDLVAVDLDPE